MSAAVDVNDTWVRLLLHAIGRRETEMAKLLISYVPDMDINYSIRKDSMHYYSDIPTNPFQEAFGYEPQLEVISALLERDEFDFYRAFTFVFELDENDVEGGFAKKLEVISLILLKGLSSESHITKLKSCLQANVSKLKSHSPKRRRLN